MTSVLADEALYRFIGGEPPSADEMAERIDRWNRGPSRPGEAWHNWAIRLAADGRAIGHLQASIVDNGRKADIAWVVGTPWQGRGYAAEAALTLITWLNGLDVRSITAHIHPDNVASQRLAERLGLIDSEVVEDAEHVWRLDEERA